MALQRTRLADIQYIAATAGSIYANAAATKTYIRGLVLFNGNTTSETVKIYNVPDAAAALGASGVANQFIEQIILAKDTVFIELQHPVVLTDTNDSIQAVTTTASKVTVQILGDKDA